MLTDGASLLDGWSDSSLQSASGLLHHIASNSAEIVVTVSPRRFKSWAKGNNQAHHLRNGGFLGPFLHRSEGNGTATLSSPLVSEQMPELQLLFDTPTFSVFKPKGGRADSFGPMSDFGAAVGDSEIRIDRKGKSWQFMSVNRMDIPAGSLVVVDLQIKGTSSGRVEIRLARHGGSPAESTSKTIEVGQDWASVRVERKFMNAHEQARVQILLRPDSPETVWIRTGGVRLVRTP